MRQKHHQDNGAQKDMQVTILIAAIQQLCKTKQKRNEKKEKGEKETKKSDASLHRIMTRLSLFLGSIYNDSMC